MRLSALACVVCWQALGAVGAAWVNVTLSGVAYETGLVFPEVWNVSVRSQVSKSEYGECPVGRYCPDWTGEPLMCPLGTYSSQKKRATACPLKCFVNHYCPDPGRLVPCPEHTHSLVGATSQLDCKCNEGFQCVYRRQVSLSLVVNVPYRVWLSPAGEALKKALIQAISESAGVQNGSVKIEQVLPSVVGGAGGGGRRLREMREERAEIRSLLEKRGESAALVRVSVEGAEKIEGLQERLRMRSEFRGGARVHWRRVESLKVLPAPPGKAWEFRLWGRGGKQ